MPNGDIRFELSSGTVVSPGGFVTLPRREAQIFEVLFDRRGRMVSKESLFVELYRFDQSAEPESWNVVESHMSKMRKKLKAIGVEILSERFKGYLLPMEKAA